MPIKLKIANVPRVTRSDSLNKGLGKVIDIKESADFLLHHVEEGNFLAAHAVLSNLTGSKKVPASLRKNFGYIANMITSCIEAKTIFNEEMPLATYAKIKKEILASLDKLGEAEIKANTDLGKTRADKALDAAEQLFASPFTDPHSQEANKLKRHLNERGMSVGQAPIVFILNGPISPELLKMNFSGVNYDQGYLVIEGLNVIGVSNKFVEERGYASLKDGLELMTSTWNAKHGNRYHIYDTYATWDKALWALAIQKSDVRLLNQAAGGRFNFRRWGLSFNT